MTPTSGTNNFNVTEVDLGYTVENPICATCTDGEVINPWLNQTNFPAMQAGVSYRIQLLAQNTIGFS